MICFPGVDSDSGCGRDCGLSSLVRLVDVWARGVMNFANVLESSCSTSSASGLYFHLQKPSFSSASSFRRTDGTSRSMSLHQ